MKEDFFEAVLHCIGEVHVPLCNLSPWLTRRAEQLNHASRKMPRQYDRTVRFDLHAFIAAERLEELEIQLEARSAGHEQLAHLLNIGVFAVRSEAHDLAFI